MKTLLPALLIAGLLLCGCASNYVVTLNNGRRITTTTKPRLERGNYIFKDSKGRASYVPAGRVREIAPASMVEDETEKFKPPAK